MGSWIFRIITGHSEYSRISPGTSFVQWVASLLRTYGNTHLFEWPESCILCLSNTVV